MARPAPPVRGRPITTVDALLLLMTLIWGTNYSIVKNAFAEMDPQAFNAVRMVIASAVFLVIIFVVRRLRPASRLGRSRAIEIFVTPDPITRRDWLGIVGLGIVGHFFYQFFFIGGLARTSVANSSLMLAATPVVIALLSAALGQERISKLHWFGALLSIGGIYVVIGRGGMAMDRSTLTGDLMMFVAVLCWAIYTLGARQLMVRHSPVGVTGFSMAIGTLIYVPVLTGNLVNTDWSRVSAGTWLALAYSALFALCVAYTIWYMAVKAIGSARTSVYSNLVPIAAMLTAVVFIGEELTPAKMFGAAAVLVGVALTRVGKVAPIVPAEE